MAVVYRRAVLIDERRNHNLGAGLAIRCLGAVLTTRLTSAVAVTTDQVMKDATD